MADLKSSVGVGSGPRRCETYEECVLFNVGVSLAGPGVAAQDEEKEGEIQKLWGQKKRRRKLKIC